MNHPLEPLRKGYEEVPIPDELDLIVDRTIKQAQKARKKRSLKYKWMASVGAASLIFLIAINTSTSVAYALSTIPGVDRLIQVLTLKQYVVNEPGYNANIQVPSITHLDNKELELGLNEKYMEENEALYEKFMDEIQALEKLGGGHLGIDAGYKVKTDNDDILSIERYVVEMKGSSYEKRMFDTIDKKNEILITLPMLFKDDQYVRSISEYIIEQMKARMEADPNKIYWVDGAVEDAQINEFKTIAKDQSFYINNDSKLVIVFNEYEVAPGYMGTLEFVIPTEVISDDLVSRNYIK